MIRVQMAWLTLGMLQPSPLTKISSWDLGVRRNWEHEAIQGDSIEKRRSRWLGWKKRLAYPLADEPHKYAMCPAHKVERENLEMVGTLERIWVSVHGQRCHSLDWPKERHVGIWGSMPASWTCQNKGGIFTNSKDVPWWWWEAETYLVRAEYTLAMPCRTSGMDKVMIMSVGPRGNQ
jgi:hypothetical protein